MRKGVVFTALFCCAQFTNDTNLTIGYCKHLLRYITLSIVALYEIGEKRMQTNASKTNTETCKEYPNVACKLGYLYPNCDMTCPMNIQAEKMASAPYKTSQHSK